MDAWAHCRHHSNSLKASIKGQGSFCFLDGVVIPAQGPHTCVCFCTAEGSIGSSATKGSLLMHPQATTQELAWFLSHMATAIMRGLVTKKALLLRHFVQV